MLHYGLQQIRKLIALSLTAISIRLTEVDL